MRRLTRFGIVLLSCLGAGCGTAGVSPKAYDDTPRVTIHGEPGGPADADENLVVVAPDVIDGWQFLYRFVTETEFVLCLEGTKQDGRIIVDGFRLARMEVSTVNSVRYQPCNSARYVGTAHNHPPVDNGARSLCYQSEPDRRSFGMDPRAAVDVVLCGDAKFRWWLKDGRSAARAIVTAAKAN